MTCPPLLHGHLPRFVATTRQSPLSGASVLSPRGWIRLHLFPWHHHVGSHVPRSRSRFAPLRRCMRSHDLAIDRPDEGRQLAGDRRGDDGRPLALPGERPKAPAQPHLRFPGYLALRPRCGRHLYLLLAANTWRMPIAPSGFDQDTPRPTIAGFGDAAAVDRVACGAFGGYETEIPINSRGF